MISKTRKKIVILFFIFALPLFAHTALASQFVVTRVYNGDTLTVESEGYKLKVRLVGSDILGYHKFSKAWFSA